MLIDNSYGVFTLCELDWDENDAKTASDEFSDLVESLFEIGDWYSNSGEQYGTRPDDKFIANPESMNVWAKYIEGYKDSETTKKDIGEFCNKKQITGYANEIFVHMLNHYCMLSALDAPTEILDITLRQLAVAFVINRFTADFVVNRYK